MSYTGLAVLTFSEHSGVYVLSPILHVSPSLSAYSHHSQGSSWSRATRAKHSERRFICIAAETNRVSHC